MSSPVADWGDHAPENAGSLDSRALTSISELSDSTGIQNNSSCVFFVARFRFYGSERSFVIALLLQNICPKNARVELQTIRFDLFKSRESNIHYLGEGTVARKAVDRIRNPSIVFVAIRYRAGHIQLKRLILARCQSHCGRFQYS